MAVWQAGQRHTQQSQYLQDLGQWLLWHPQPLYVRMPDSLLSAKLCAHCWVRLAKSSILLNEGQNGQRNCQELFRRPRLPQQTLVAEIVSMPSSFIYLLALLHELEIWKRVYELSKDDARSI
jgi:hypothetical protein